MMDGYNPKSCNALEKPYYRPIEAAIRWCGLVAHEAQILTKIGVGAVPETGQFPQWPCLRTNTERIFDAILHGNIPRGRDGRTVGARESVAKDRITVRHSDLREWMVKHCPDQKPQFLFDEIERKTHAAFNADTFLALQGDRDAARMELERVKADAQNLRADIETKGFQIAAMERQIGALNAKLEAAGAPDEQSKTTYLNIISALLDCIAGKLPKTEKHPSFASEAKLIEAIDEHYRGYRGLSQSNLSRKFPEAKRSMAEQ